jgi:hypothetical protein
LVHFFLIHYYSDLSTCSTTHSLIHHLHI